MKNRQILRALSLLAAVCIAAGCNQSASEEAASTTVPQTNSAAVTETEETTISEDPDISEPAELEVDHVDEEGTVYYKNPTEWTYEMVYEALTIEGKKVQAPLTFEDFGDKYSLNDATLTYFEELSRLDAGIIYNGKKFGSVIFLDCADKYDTKNKEIAGIGLRNPEQELQDDFPDIKINGITLGSSRSEIISVLGTPSSEIYDGSHPFSLSYNSSSNSNDSSLIFILNDNKVRTMYIELHY